MTKTKKVYREKIEVLGIDFIFGTKQKDKRIFLWLFEDILKFVLLDT